MIARAAVLVNPRYPAAIECARELIRILTEHGIWVGMPEESAHAVDPGRQADAADLANCDLAIAAGGDGTSIRAARLVHQAGGDGLAIRFGRFGFLAEVLPNEAANALDAILRGDYLVRERLMAKAILRREGEVEQEFLALNDAVVTTGGVARTIDLDVFVGGAFLATMSADGIIVSTPTGASAYSVAAGGPLVGPSVAAFIVTPICPHTLSARSLVIADSEEVRIITREATSKKVYLTIDGQINVRLQTNDEVIIRRSGHSARFVDMDGESFYQKLRSHFWWGERYRTDEVREP